MHRALVVGISDYGRLNQPLPGCGNDMKGWSAFFAKALGLGADNIRLLADSRATRTGIIERIRWLLSDVGRGDQRIFVFAGHGAQLRRRNPQTGVVADKLDETLVAYPGATDDYEDFMIFDEDLARLVDESGFPNGADLTFVFDACHSAGMMRELLGLGVDGPLPRCLRIPQDMLARSFGESQADVRPLGALESARLKVPRLIVAAAKAEQSAWDDRMPDGARHGVFSFYALSMLMNSPRVTADALIAATGLQVAAKFPQHPMLLGTEERFHQPLTR